MAKNEKTTKATSRNMRSKKDGSVLNANHVTLEATREGQSHIDETQFKQNAYWRFESDGKITLIQGGSGGFNATKHEIKRYKELFGEGQDAKNERYIKNRNKGNCRTIEELYRNPKTAPMESLWQIGNSKEEVMPTYELRIAVFKAWSETVKEIQKKWGDNVKFLDAGLHMEEKVPHIHSRMVIGAKDKYGYFAPNQTQGFQEMKVERPDPTKPRSRYNNELIAFSDTVREMFYRNCEKQGLVIDREVRSASHRQKELLEHQVEQLLKEVQKHREVSRTAQEALEKTLGNIDSLNGQIKALEAAKAALEKDKAVLETDKKNLERKVDSLVEEKKELKAENLRLRNDNRDLELQISDKERQEMQLSIQIQNKTKEINEKEIAKAKAEADRQAAVDALAEIEKHQEQVYRNSASRFVKKYETIPAQKEKKNLRGQVVQEARPECVVVSKEDLERTIEQAKYNVNTHYYNSRIEELNRQLQTNEIYADQQRQIADMRMELNQRNVDVTRANRVAMEKDSQLQDALDFIRQKGMSYEYESQIRSQHHTYHHHR